MNDIRHVHSITVLPFVLHNDESTHLGVRELAIWDPGKSRELTVVVGNQVHCSCCVLPRWLGEQDSK
jgi:hypothetical protein